MTLEACKTLTILPLSATGPFLVLPEHESEQSGVTAFSLFCGGKLRRQIFLLKSNYIGASVRGQEMKQSKNDR